MKPNLLVVGSHAPAMFVDVERPPLIGETIKGENFRDQIDGGKGSNQAIAAARLGASVSFIGRVGNDRLGKTFTTWLESDSVDHQWLFIDEEHPTGAGLNIQTDDGDCALITWMGANQFLSKEQVEAAIEHYPSSKILLTQFEIPHEIALFASDLAVRLGKMSIVNPAPATKLDCLAQHQISILVPNKIEAFTLLGLDISDDQDLREICYELRDAVHAESVIITLGKDGSIGLDNDGIWEITAPQVESIDASGAGDVFCAAIGVGLLDGKSIREASKWAAYAAALSVTRQGTIPAFPYRNELDKFIKAQLEGLNV